MEYNFIRVWFKKIHEAKYLSHLDINRCFMRALSVSGLPFWYTEGFNPHLFVTFSAPLALGISGMCECFDVKLPYDFDISCLKEMSCINRSLPKGLEILEFSVPVMKNSEICYSHFELKFHLQDGERVKDISKFFQKEEIIIEKKTKAGNRNINLKKSIKKLSIRRVKDFAYVNLILSLHNSVNPVFIVNCINQELGEEFFCEITRKCVLNKKFQIFR